MARFIQEDTKTKQKCFFGFCCHSIWRYKRGKELTNKKEQIKKLMETEKDLAIGLPACLPDIECYSSQYYIPFKSWESTYKELFDALNDDNNYIVGLQGMVGTGKTTLAKEVGKELNRSNQFTHVIDTTVSFSPDIKKIQDDIAGPLGLEFGACNESDRPKKLWSRLTNGEKILLILDDVWGDIDFNDIGIPHSDNHKGCRVFVTTRNLWVCKRLGCSKTIQLDLLSEEDTWIMFQKHAGLTKFSTKNLLDKGRKIAKECKSLPIAIAAIASSLKGEQRPEEWDVALNSLKHMSMGGVDKDFVGVYKCLKFSYDNLNDNKTKELFLLCSIFQEDEEISTEVLTRLSIGVGLFGEGYDKYNHARNLLVVAKNKLLDSCLLLKTDERDVKMHGLVREVAKWIANKEEILVVDCSKENIKSLVGRSNIKYLLFVGSPNDLCSPRFDGSKLKILILIMVTGCFVDSFFENIAGLRVLNLIAGERITLSLPQSIRLLTNIRSLLIESFDLGNISVLGSLQSLETLDLKRSTIEELPQEIAKLKKLRLLNLGYCRIKSNNPFEVIQRCPFLEELYFEYSFNDFCQEITLPALERYHLIEGYSKFYDSSLLKCVSLEHDYLSEATFKHVMQTAEYLTLKRFKKRWRNIMPEIVPIDEGMNDLIKLCLEDDSQLQCLVDTEHIGCSQVPNVFSKLVVLKLSWMDNLKELCNGPISFESMNSLEELTIRYCGNLRSLFKCKLNLCNLKTIKLQSCPMLVSLFHPSTYRSLVLLEELQIANCQLLENIISDERREEELREEIDDGDDNDNKNHGSMFSKLKVLDIEECPRLRLQYILPFLKCNDLEKLSIKDSNDLRSLFKCKLSLCNLKTIKLQNCPMLVSLFQPLTYQSLVLLEKLQIANCERLENIISNEIIVGEETDNDDDDDDDESHASMLQKLKVLDIEGCPQLAYIFPLLSAQGLPLLEEIRIRRCDVLKDIFDQDHSMIYHLDIWKRVQCVSLLQSHIMCNIKEINLSHFLEIKSVFMLSITPRLLVETLTITNCNELKNIVIDTVGGKRMADVFPRLKRINVEDCDQLEYIFGHSTHDHQKHNKVRLHLPTLEHINLRNLPALVAMSTKQYRTTFPPSAKLKHNGCSQVAINSFHEFVTQPISKPQGIEISVDEGSSSTNAQTIPSHDYGDGQISIEDVNVDGSHETTEINNQVSSNTKEQIPKDDDDDRVSKSRVSSVASGHELSSSHENGIVSKKYEIVETKMNATAEGKQEFVVNIPGLVIKMKQRKNSQVIVETKMKQTASANQEFVVNVSGLEILEVPNSPTNSQDDDWDGHITRPSPMGMAMIEPLATQYVVDDEDREENLYYATKVEELRHFNYDLQNERDLETTEDFAAEMEVQATSGHRLTSSHENDIDSNILGLETKMKQTEERDQDFIENVSDLKITSIANSEVLMNGQSTSQQCLMDQLGVIDTAVIPSQDIMLNLEDVTTLVPNAKTVTSSTHSEQIISSSGPLVINDHKPSSHLEGSTSEKTAAADTMSTDSKTKNEADTQLYAPKQKASANDNTITSSTHSESVSSSSSESETSSLRIEKSVEEGTTSTYDKTITSSTHLEDGVGKISTPSFSTVNTKLPATKYVDIGDSQETIAVEDINKLIEEDPLLALEKLLTGVQSLSIGTLVQELKTLMNSSSDLDHLVSNQESKSKLISLFHGLNQHQGLLPSDVKEFVEKVQNFFNENIIKHATYQEVLKKHNQLLDSKTDLMNKLRSAKSTQAHIDSETSTANSKIHELPLHIENLENQRDGLKSVVNKCDVQKMKLKAECIELAQQSKELIFALASSEVDVREVERARNLAKEEFANLKSSFPKF